MRRMKKRVNKSVKFLGVHVFLMGLVLFFFLFCLLFFLLLNVQKMQHEKVTKDTGSQSEVFIWTCHVIDNT